MNSSHLNDVTSVKFMFQSIFDLLLCNAIEIALNLMAVVQCYHGLRVQFRIWRDTAEEGNFWVCGELSLQVGIEKRLFL